MEDLSLVMNISYIFRALYDDRDDTLLQYLPIWQRRSLVREIIRKWLLKYDSASRQVIAKTLVMYDDADMLGFYMRVFNIHVYYSDNYIHYRAERCLRLMIDSLGSLTDTHDDAMFIDLFTGTFLHDIMASGWVAGMRIVCNRAVLEKNPDLSMRMLSNQVVRQIFSKELNSEIVDIYCEHTELVLEYMRKNRVRVSLTELTFRWSVVEHTGKLTPRCFEQALRLFESVRTFWSSAFENQVQLSLFDAAAISAIYLTDAVMLARVLQWGESANIFPHKKLFYIAATHHTNEGRSVDVDIVALLLSTMHFGDLTHLRAKTSIMYRALKEIPSRPTAEALAQLLVQNGFRCVYFDCYCICLERGMPSTMRAIMEKERTMRKTQCAIARSLSTASVQRLRDMVDSSKVVDAHHPGQDVNRAPVSHDERIAACANLLRYHYSSIVYSTPLSDNKA